MIDIELEKKSGIRSVSSWMSQSVFRFDCLMIHSFDWSSKASATEDRLLLMKMMIVIVSSFCYCLPE